jgi:hypothetical protein
MIAMRAVKSVPILAIGHFAPLAQTRARAGNVKEITVSPVATLAQHLRNGRTAW